MSPEYDRTLTGPLHSTARRRFRRGSAPPRAFSGIAQGPGGGWPLWAIEIATPTSEAAISTDQKMIAM